MGTLSGDARRAELADNLARVNERISLAAERAGRARDEINLVVVTKTFPASDVVVLHELGVRDVAENRHQEAEAKAALCPDDLRWHFVGGLQSNKAAAVARYASVVQSVDRLSLVSPLARGAAERAEPVRILLQVSLDPPGSAHRSGAPVEQLVALGEAVASEPSLRLSGLMAVAPLGVEPLPHFVRLQEVHETFGQHFPEATWLSAGMSGDFEAAIACGATHVRVGAAVLGSRASGG